MTYWRCYVGRRLISKFSELLVIMNSLRLCYFMNQQSRDLPNYSSSKCFEAQD